MRHFFHPSVIILSASLGIILGVILAQILRWNFFASPLWLAAALALIIFAILRPNFTFIILAFLAGMLISFFRVATTLSDAKTLGSLQDQTIIISGIISTDPDTADSGTSFTLKSLVITASNDVSKNSGESLNNGNDSGASGTSDSVESQSSAVSSTEKSETETQKSLAGSLYIRVAKISNLSRDMKITLKGKLASGFGTFSGSMFRPEILETHPPNNPALNFRNWFIARVKSVIDSPAAELGTAYLLGERTGLSSDFNEKLRLTGLTFIVVASGAHLSILVGFAKKLFSKLSRKISTIISIILIFFFMAIVGWTPSILRAGFMSLMTTLASYSGRRLSSLRLILLVAAFTLLLDPTLIQSLGWQMSFAAYFGIMVMGPKITRFFHGAKKPPWLSSELLTSLSATFMVTPISLYFFGATSLITPVASLIISPTLAPAMGLTFLSGLTKSPLISNPTTLLLNFHIWLIDLLGSTSVFQLQIDPGNPYIFLVYTPLTLLFLPKMLKLYTNRGEKIMSGHSKWETTKRQKAVVDAKRGALFTKIGNQIAIAARKGTDPSTNPSLAMMLEKARHANMPKANIERAIARAADKNSAALIEETYEAYGPGGVGIIIEVATDNKNRTMPEVRHTLDKNGGRMADQGSVMFQFSRKGVIDISEKGEDALMLALDAGAEDAEEFEEGTVITTAPTDLMKVKDKLTESGLTVTSAELKYVPTNTVDVPEDLEEKLEKLLDALDDLDDVVSVHTNAA